MKTRQISLRDLKRIIFALMIGIVLETLLLGRSAYLRLYSLQNEKIHWQNLLLKKSVESDGETELSAIPVMDELPDMIEQCCLVFKKKGISVDAFNVERFGEPTESGKRLNLDYGLVRLRLRGAEEEIFRSLKELEEMQPFSIHVQEVVLKAEEGEALLRIDFCTGREQNAP